MRWDEQDLLDPRSVSVHAWCRKMFMVLSVVPFARNVLDQKVTTFEDADSLLSSIIMCSFSNKLCTEYFTEHSNCPVPIAVDLFDWAIKKCTEHSAAKEYKLILCYGQFLSIRERLARHGQRSQHYHCQWWTSPCHQDGRNGQPLRRRISHLSDKVQVFRIHGPNRSLT